MKGAGNVSGMHGKQKFWIEQKILKVKIGLCLQLLRVKSFSTQKGSLMDETEAADA